jgi:protein-tyrosine phosphatase
MSKPQKNNLLWWIIPGVLAGGGALHDFDDELQTLYSAGVRAVVSLLNIPTDSLVYHAAGFAFLCLPVPDGGAPTMEQADEFVRFVAEQRAANRPVAVHCEGGLGRTGTLLAAYLIAQGEGAVEAIGHVRAVESVAIETARQIQFLEEYERRVRSKAT